MYSTIGILASVGHGKCARTSVAQFTSDDVNTNPGVSCNESLTSSHQQISRRRWTRQYEFSLLAKQSGNKHLSPGPIAASCMRVSVFAGQNERKHCEVLTEVTTLNPDITELGIWCESKTMAHMKFLMTR